MIRVRKLLCADTLTNTDTITNTNTHTNCPLYKSRMGNGSREIDDKLIQVGFVRISTI